MSAEARPRERILAVDDQPENLELLAELLADSGYEPVLARDGAEALAEVERRLPHAVLLDVMMPRLDGFTLCRQLKSRRPTCFVPIVILTALSDVDSKVRGLESGADDFLNKPFHRPELLARLAALLRIRRLRDELDSTEAVLFAMVDLLESKDPRRRHHSLRVAALARSAARRLGVHPREEHDLVLGALLHDLGKIAVPDALLSLSEREMSGAQLAVYRDHPRVGERILATIPSFGVALPVVRGHHERLDGSGYPDALAGDQLSAPVEIVAAANLWDVERTAAAGDPEAGRRALLAAERAGQFRSDVIAAVVAAAGEPLTERLDEVLPPPMPLPGGRVLVADDRADNRAFFREVLEAGGLEPILVESGEAALAWLASPATERPDLLLLDVRMPGPGGLEVCRRVREQNAETLLPILLVTAHEDATMRDRVIAAGADDLLLAPVHRLELVARVRSLLRLRLYHEDLIRHENVVLSLSAALEAKDPSTRGHSQRVGELAERLAEELGLPAERRAMMRTAGLLHDIGKVAVPDRLLEKPSRLTPEEFATIMTHPRIGWEICRRLRLPSEVLDCILHHHERFDGGGYPLGLAGEAIGVPARLLAVADALDALTSDRAYRPRLELGEALALLGRETGEGKWDPTVMTALERLATTGRVDVRRESAPASVA